MNGENDTMYYVSKDYLGSFDVITDERGNVLERFSFDPWGRRRNPVDWTFTDVPTPHLFDRGYTGHEHLDKFGLINMNGRVYDPWLSRFLSPDPFVQTPTYSQSYNRYSYCLNNPLKYVDPSGYKMLSLQEIIENLWNSPYSQYGGTWTSSSGYHYFGSFNEGLDAGIAYQNEHSSWSGTIGGNENGTRELYSFFNSTPYNPNIVRGVIYDQYWVDYNKTTGQFYYCHTMDEVDIIDLLLGFNNNLSNDNERLNESRDVNILSVSDKASLLGLVLASPFELMEYINMIKGGDKLMAKVMGNIANSIGRAFFVYNAYYYYTSDGKFSVGDAARLVSNAAYFLPYGIGAIYGAIDVGFGVSGYSLTDQFGDWIDYHLGSYHDVDPRFFKSKNP